MQRLYLNWWNDLACCGICQLWCPEITNAALQHSSDKLKQGFSNKEKTFFKESLSSCTWFGENVPLFFLLPLGWIGYNLFSSVHSFLCIFLFEILTTVKSVQWKTSLSHPLPAFPKKIDTSKSMKYNAKCCLPKECLKFLRDNALFQNKAISGNSILVSSKLFIWEAFFSSTNILALGFVFQKEKKKVFWKISFILLQFKIKQTKPDSAEVQTNCRSCCPCLVEASTIPLEHPLQTLFIWQSASGGLLVLFIFFFCQTLPRILCHA